MAESELNGIPTDPNQTEVDPIPDVDTEQEEDGDEYAELPDDLLADLGIAPDATEGDETESDENDASEVTEPAPTSEADAVALLREEVTRLKQALSATQTAPVPQTPIPAPVEAPAPSRDQIRDGEYYSIMARQGFNAQDAYEMFNANDGQAVLAYQLATMQADNEMRSQQQSAALRQQQELLAATVGTSHVAAAIRQIDPTMSAEMAGAVADEVARLDQSVKINVGQLTEMDPTLRGALLDMARMAAIGRRALTAQQKAATTKKPAAGAATIPVGDNSPSPRVAPVSVPAEIARVMRDMKQSGLPTSEIRAVYDEYIAQERALRGGR